MTTKAAAPKFTVKNLAEAISITDAKRVRHLLRTLAQIEQHARYMPVDGKRYVWSKSDFAIVSRKAEKLAIKLDEQCDSRCTHSIIDVCECHCGGANHGIHASR